MGYILPPEKTTYPYWEGEEDNDWSSWSIEFWGCGWSVSPIFCPALGSNDPSTQPSPQIGTPVFLTIRERSGGGWNASANPTERWMRMKCDQLSKFPLMENHWLDRDLIIYYMDQERKCIHSAVLLITPPYRSAPVSVRLYKWGWTKGGLRGSGIGVILVSQTRWDPTPISTYLTNTFSLGITPLPNWIV